VRSGFANNEIGGHCDARGSDAYNLDLSQKRANAVLEYLLSKYPQISREQYAAKGYGERVPIASNKTVEGMANGATLDPVQQGFVECHGLQCGFCTPGMMLTSRWLLDHNPDPSEDQIREAISGQSCRCTGYENIVKAVRWAAEHPAESQAEEVSAS